MDIPSRFSLRPFPVLLLAVAVLPWTLLVRDGTVDLVFAFGLVNGRTFHLVSLPRYVALTQGLPDRLLAWPISVLLYLAGVASAALSLIGREDRRVTAGLFAVAGVSHLFFAIGLLTTNPTITPIPVGTIALWAVAWATIRVG